MKKINCYKCGRELVPLETSQPKIGIYKFFCDKCSIEINIFDKKVEEFDKIKKSKDITYIKNKYPKIMELLSKLYILDNHFRGNKYQKYSDNNCHICYGKEYPVLLDIDNHDLCLPSERKITLVCKEAIELMIYDYAVELSINKIYYNLTDKLDCENNENYILNIDMRTDIDYIIWRIIKCSLGDREAEYFMNEIGKEFKNEEDELS